MTRDWSAPAVVSADGEPVATAYTFSLLPEDSQDWDTFAVRVEYRGYGRWAVMRHGHCLNTSDEWDYERNPSGRDDDWLNEHRFALDEALTRARRILPTITCNGHTYSDALALMQETS